MQEHSTRLDRFNQWARDNPILSVLIVLGTLVVAVSTFTDAARNLMGVVSVDRRPEINGAWQAEVSYDWKDARYAERFDFRGEADELYGAASFLGEKRTIRDGVVTDKTLRFVTTTQEILGSEAPRPSIHRYRGIYSGDRIRFVMQTEGGYTEHVPIEFIAQRARDRITPSD